MIDMTRAKQAIGLIVWLALSFTAGAFGSIASVEAGSLYDQLLRPEWASPAWLFGPAWTFLYALMGLAAWLVWRVQGFRAVQGALSLFIVQLAVSTFWTWIFFVWRRGASAFVEILLLWALILMTLVAFWRIRPLAGILMIPYLGWVTYACGLTYVIWRLNPHILS